jgi:aspartate kinase
MQVFKFGGASVKNAEAVKNIGQILKKYKGERLVVVISAMDKTTNQLENLVQALRQNKDHHVILQDVLSFHRDMAKRLLGSVCERAERFLDDLEDACEQVATLSWIQAYDRIVPFGELLSTSIIADYLSQELHVKWLDARRFIATDSFHTEANIEWGITERASREIISPLLSENVVITQGFIGSNAQRESTTLGREGSDFTAAILAYCLDADGLTVWKDVPGILNADPKLYGEAQQFSGISYREATEMTYYGAKVIHPKTLRPLAQKHIPLTVRSFLDHDAPGTLISAEHAVEKLPVYIFKDNQLLFTIEVRDNSFMDEKRLSLILAALDKQNVKINLMQNSALTFSFCMDNKAYKIEPLIDSLAGDFEVRYEEPLKLITIKNYDDRALKALPVQVGEQVLVQKTPATYQIVYRN